MNEIVTLSTADGVTIWVG